MNDDDARHLPYIVRRYLTRASGKGRKPELWRALLAYTAVAHSIAHVSHVRDVVTMSEIVDATNTLAPMIGAPDVHYEPHHVRRMIDSAIDLGLIDTRTTASGQTHYRATLSSALNDT